MSKSYIVNGENMLNKCIAKASKDEAVIFMDINNQGIIDAISMLSNIDKCKEILMILNIKPDEELEVASKGEISHKEKLVLIDRLIHKEISKGDFKDLVTGIEKLRKLISEQRIKIYIQITVSKNLSLFELNYTNNSGTRLILADTSDSSNEICSVTQYTYGESPENSLGQMIRYKTQINGRSCAGEILGILDNILSVNSVDTKDLFLKSLYEINENHLESNNKHSQLVNNIDILEFKFQSDGVDALISILNKYGIAYLADSVGLGKTIVALRLLAKTGYRALVVTPNDVIIEQWKESNRHISNIQFCINSYQDLDKVVKSNKEFDIIIFDEAQNFRNMNTLRYIRAQELCSGRLVLLMGATPINNGIEDIEAQLMLGLNPKCKYDFGVGLVGDFFKELKKSTNKSKKHTAEYKKAQKIAGDKARALIISKIMVRRTRKDIERYYAEDMETGKLSFPVVEEPVIVKYKYNGIKLARTLDILSGYNFNLKLTYALYNEHKYMDVENSVEIVENEGIEEFRGIANRENSLAGLTKIRLIKLLDSSVEAFVKSINNMIEAIEIKLEELQGYGKVQLDLFGISTVSPNQSYIDDLEHDKYVLNEILNMWVSDNKYIDADVKVQELHNILQKHPDEKIVIFTEFIATAQALYNKLNVLGYNVVEVDGTNNRENIGNIIKSFSLAGWNDYDILITTNILSEGVNLNRVSVAINYDITWNPMIITQRVGRLNRIDSVVRSIKIYNFFPCDEMDTAILSESNIISKYALAAYSIGIDENYLSTDSDDISTSLMEYREGILSNIQSGFIDEELDFKTVDFKYAKLASKLLNDEQIKNLPNALLVKSLYSDELGGTTLGLVKNRGKLIAIRHADTGYSYISTNDFLDILYDNLNSDESKISVNSTVLNNMIQKIKSDYDIRSLTETSKNFYLYLLRLRESIEDLDDNAKILPNDAIRMCKVINNILYNIKSGKINEYLSGIYLDRLHKEAKNGSGIIEQFKFLITQTPRRFMEAEYISNSRNNLNIIAIIQFIKR